MVFDFLNLEPSVIVLLIFVGSIFYVWLSVVVSFPALSSFAAFVVATPGVITLGSFSSFVFVVAIPGVTSLGSFSSFVFVVATPGVITLGSFSSFVFVVASPVTLGSF